MYDCALSDSKNIVEIDIIKLPATKEVRLRIRNFKRSKLIERKEDVDIRDVYANLIDDKIFHLETLEHEYYLSSSQDDIPNQEIVDDINAFQTDGNLPQRYDLTSKTPLLIAPHS